MFDNGSFRRRRKRFKRFGRGETPAPTRPKLNCKVPSSIEFAAEYRLEPVMGQVPNSVPVMGHYIQDQPNFYPVPNIPESYMIQHYNKRPTRLPCDPAEQQILDPSVFLTTPPTTPPTETSTHVFNMSPVLGGVGEVSPPNRYCEDPVRSPNYLHEVTISSDEVPHSQSPPSTSYIALHSNPS